jgi:2-methylisocitrate lyase-like PEP mutase family enzyme
MSHAKTLRAALQRGTCLRAPGVYDGLSALLAEQAGFEMAFVSGACISFARHGRPDMGLVSMSEVADCVALMRERVTLPLSVDIDTGFGNALNVQRTVRVFERAGASALQMEDQVMPKRCGHMTGKQVIAADEMVGKIRAALDARHDPDTLLIARTDALGVNGFDDALERAERYLEAGADALFIEAPKTAAQMQRIARQFASRIPLVHNLVEGGGSPVPDAASLETLGYRVALYPAALLHLFVPQAQALLAHIRSHGSTHGYAGLIDLNRINTVLGAPDLLAAADRYGR